MDKSMKLEDLTKRINELYHKQKSSGLTEDEQKEQTELRNEYRARFRASLLGDLDSIKIKEPDGTVHKVTKKPS